LTSPSFLQVTIALLEQEMVLDQLILHLLLHAIQWKVRPLEILVRNTSQRTLDLLFHGQIVNFLEDRIERKATQGTATADSEKRE
jgi:hypothetical protein